VGWVDALNVIEHLAVTVIIACLFLLVLIHKGGVRP
jgi:hypothetical protein